MNAIYKVIYNQSTQTFQAVSELGKSHQSSAQTTKLGGLKKVLTKAKSLLALSVALILSHTAIAAPTGGQVVAGQAGISQTALTTTINQTSQNAAINWQNFGIAPNESVNFHQPNPQAVTLNRVLGNETSVIDGAMRANGKVFITNPNGVLIGKDATINVGSLLATTADIGNDDFMAGRYRFDNAAVANALRDGAGKIVQLGNIRVPKGGSVALVAPIVENYGTITAIEGNVLLASADKFRVTLDGETLGYTLDKGVLQGLVDNGGMIVADGGAVVLTSLGVDTLKKSLIKHSGVIQANTVINKGGRIELLGDLDHSRLELSGTLQAKAKDGDGGFVETSAARLDIKDTAHVSTQSTNGKTGTWVIDPQDFTVAPTGGDMTGQQVGTALQSNNVTLKSIDGKTDGKGDVIINDTITWDNNTLTLNAQNDIHINKTITGTGTAKLALEYGQGSSYGKVEVIKDGKTDYQDNDYHLDKNTPIAQRTVKINLPAGQNFSTKKGTDGEVLDFEVIHQMPAIVKNSDDEWESKFTTHNIAIGADIDVSHTKNYEGFAGWQLPKDGNNEWGRVHGLGHTVDGLTIRSGRKKEDNQDVGLFQQNARNYLNDQIIRNIGVTNININSKYSVDGVGGVAGFGYNLHDNYATGTIVAEDHSVKAGGLVGQGGDIRNSYAAVNVSSEGYHSYAGGLVGSGGYIYNSYATGNVVAKDDDTEAGGLAGFGSYIFNSYATGSVITMGNYTDVGGLVGFGGDIYNSYATGDVSSNGYGSLVGGLLGSGDKINQSYATGQVSTSGSFSDAGGLVGYGHSVYNSYSTGNVETTGDNANAGGLIGNGGYIYSSYTIGQISATGKNSKAGGLSGRHTDSQISKNSFFNNSKNPNLLAIGRHPQGIDQPNTGDATGKTDTELKQKSTFKDWDFDNVWYITEGVDTPRLQALATKLTITPTTQPPEATEPPQTNPVQPEPVQPPQDDTAVIEQPPQTDPVQPPTPQPNTPVQTTVKAHDISKTYDGKAVQTVDDLKAIAKSNGYDDIITVEGLKDGDTLGDPSIFTGTLDYAGDWKGAKDVKTDNNGKYTIIPFGLSGGQKYQIEFQEGSLKIKPKNLTITAMNNIKPANAPLPQKNKIGIFAEGLVGNDTITNVNIDYEKDFPKYNDSSDEGGFHTIYPSGAKFGVGKAQNYNITYNAGKILTVQEHYDAAKHLQTDEKKIKEYDETLSAIEDEMLLAKAVYGGGDHLELKKDYSGVIPIEDNTEFSTNENFQRFFEIWQVESEDSRGNKHLSKRFADMKENSVNKIKDGKEYTTLSSLSFDTSQCGVTLGCKKLYEIVKDGNGDPVITDLKNHSGLQAALYKKTDDNSYYLVFRGTDPSSPADWANNLAQGLYPFAQHKIASAHLKIILGKSHILKDFDINKFKVVGHSLGGGLTQYAVGTYGDTDVQAITFNSAELGLGAEWKIKEGNYNKAVNYVFDKDWLNKLNNLGSNNAHQHAVGKTKSIEIIAHKNKDGGRFDDHAMIHIITSQKLASIMADNIKKVENAKNPTYIQKLQWQESLASTNGKRGYNGTRFYVQPSLTPKEVTKALNKSEAAIKEQQNSAPIANQIKKDISKLKGSKNFDYIQSNQAAIRNVIEQSNPFRHPMQISPLLNIGKTYAPSITARDKTLLKNQPHLKVVKSNDGRISLVKTDENNLFKQYEKKATDSLNKLAISLEEKAAQDLESSLNAFDSKQAQLSKLRTNLAIGHFRVEYADKTKSNKLYKVTNQFIPLALNAGDIITTKAESSIILPDKSVLILKPNTKIRVEKTQHDSTNLADFFTLLEGSQPVIKYAKK